jgi:hypothetical protein
MSRRTETKNEARVLEAFDTLFNKRDYVAAERRREFVVPPLLQKFSENCG